MQHIANGLAIFLLISTLIAGPATSSFVVYGQSNETNAPSEDVSQILTDITPPEENNENTEPVISENGSSSSALGFDDNQNTSSESNQAATSVGGGSSNSQPDGDCLFDPSLPKCAPDEVGNCPDGFGMNEDEQCFPLHDRCPEGYHSHEDDESGRCIPSDVPCDPGYIMNPEYPSCDSKDRVCQNHPDVDVCKQDDDGGSNNMAYKSGYNHGCSDAKIYDNSKRHINQQGKGPSFHTNEFIKGYNDGLESCSIGDNPSSPPPPPSTPKGIFKVIVEVVNNSPTDLSGGITVNMDHSPENIVKSTYGLYFPGGGAVYKTFTFK